MRCYYKICTNSPLRTISLCRGDNALFSLHKRKKFQKRSVRTCGSIALPHHLPSKEIPTSPHARIFGSNGVPQRDYKFPQSQIFPHGVHTTKPEFRHAPCAPRAIYFFVGTGVLDCPPCAWGFFARLCPLSVTFRATSPLGEAFEFSRPTEPSAHETHSPFGSLINYLPLQSSPPERNSNTDGDNSIWRGIV